MSGWLETVVIEKRAWTDALFSLRVQGPRPAFEAGQFVRIALDLQGESGDERVARAFSFVNAPADPVSEFYGVVVPQGRLSGLLAGLRPGDRLYVSTLASGFLVLPEIPDAAALWMLATGTGIAPFLSILQEGTLWRRFPGVVLVHAARRASDLAYRPLIERLQKAHAALRYVPMLSRERVPGTLEGRIPAAIADGRLEGAAGASVSTDTHFMLCGNPDMVTEATAVRKHRRRAPGHITVERFW